MDTILPPYTPLIRNYFPKSITRPALRKRLEQVFADVHSVYHKFGISESDYMFDANSNPFFVPPESTTIEDFLKELNMDTFKNLRATLPDGVVLNPWLISLYMLAGSDTRAFTIGHYTIFSYKQMIDRILDYLKENPLITWTDIGVKCQGMGHVEVLRMDIQNGALFIQPDGGSNGWDRQAYWDEYRDQKVPDEKHIGFLDFVQTQTPTN